MQFTSCHKNRSFDDSVVLSKICFDTLAIDYIEKPKSNDFCAIFLEGRFRDINTYEDYACLHSFKVFSEKNYPIFAFINEDVIRANRFLDKETIEKWNIMVIKISEVSSRREYAMFNYIYNPFNKIDGIDKCLTLHPDGFLIKGGWEDYVVGNDFDFIGANWLHKPRIRSTNTVYDNALSIYNPIYGCNGGFSFRKASKMNEIIKQFSCWGFDTLYENGREDKFPPPEDLFFNFLGWNSGLIKPPTVKQCLEFSLDPITLDEYNDKSSFGFHFPKKVNEFKQQRDYLKQC